MQAAEEKKRRVRRIKLTEEGETQQRNVVSSPSGIRRNTEARGHPSDSYFLIERSRNLILERSSSCTPPTRGLPDSPPRRHLKLPHAIHLTAVDPKKRSRPPLSTHYPSNVLGGRGTQQQAADAEAGSVGEEQVPQMAGGGKPVSRERGTSKTRGTASGLGLVERSPKPNRSFDLMPSHRRTHAEDEKIEKVDVRLMLS